MNVETELCFVVSMSLRPSQSLCLYQILDNLGNILLATLNPTITCSPEQIRGFLLVELDILKNSSTQE